MQNEPSACGILRGAAEIDRPLVIGALGTSLTFGSDLPDASTQARGVFKQFGVTEFAAEDERVESASTFVSYSTKASPAIEISKGRTSPYTVRAFHLELPEGCGVVYLD